MHSNFTHYQLNAHQNTVNQVTAVSGFPDQAQPPFKHRGTGPPGHFAMFGQEEPKVRRETKRNEITHILRLEIVCGILVVLFWWRGLFYKILKQTRLQHNATKRVGFLLFAMTFLWRRVRCTRKTIIKSLSVLDPKLENKTRGKGATCQPTAHKIPCQQNFKIKMNDVILYLIPSIDYQRTQNCSLEMKVQLTSRMMTVSLIPVTHSSPTTKPA